MNPLTQFSLRDKRVFAGEIVLVAKKTNPDATFKTASYSYGAVLSVRCEDGQFATKHVDKYWDLLNDPQVGDYFVESPEQGISCCIRRKIFNSLFKKERQ